MKKVGIVRGGKGKNYKTSLKRGGEVILQIKENLGDKWQPLDILIDKDGVWHLNGKPIKPANLVNQIDVAWNLVSPEISVTLGSLAIPNIGQKFYSFENSKELLREHMKRIGVPMPRSLVIPLYQPDFDGPREKFVIRKAKEVHEKFGAPWMVKSFNEDANMAIHLAKTFDELVGAIDDGVQHGDSIVVEEFITGKIASLHTLPGFRSGDLPTGQAGNIYTFPVGNSFGNFSVEQKAELTSLAKTLHTHLGGKHYLKSDFVVNNRGKIYLLQIDSHPDVQIGSHLSQAAESVGAQMHQLVEHILEQAFKN